MALASQDYEFLANMLRNVAQYDNRSEGSITCKVLRRHMGEKILRHAKDQNSGFNETKFRELANLPIE